MDTGWLSWTRCCGLGRARGCGRVSQLLVESLPAFRSSFGVWSSGFASELVVVEHLRGDADLAEDCCEGDFVLGGSCHGYGSVFGLVVGLDVGGDLE